ncbi:MAG: AAA family ATPase [Candidatus Thorarchaeota archaeon]
MEQLAMTSFKELVSLTGLDERTAKRVLKNARYKMRLGLLESGLEVEVEDATKQRLETGIPQIDSYLRGGVESKSIVELYGPQWGGKTLLCAQLAVLTQMHHQVDRPPQKVVWYDADGTFRKDTVREIAFRFGLDPEDVLEHVHVVEMTESLTLADYFNVLMKTSATENVVLIIMDSLKQALATCSDSPKLAELLRKIKQACWITGAVFVVTNRSLMQLSSLSGQDAESFGGHTLRHVENYQVLLEPKSEHELRFVLKQVKGLEENAWTIMQGYGGLYQDRKSMSNQVRRVSRYLGRMKKDIEK